MLKRLRDRLREIKPAEFRKMESEAANVTVDLLGMFRENFGRAIKSIDGLMERPDYCDAGWRSQLYRLSHDLKGLGGTFEYDLATVVGGSLCTLIRNEALPADQALQRRIIAHIAALKAILLFDLKGDGGHDGEALLATLRMEPIKHAAQ